MSPKRKARHVEDSEDVYSFLKTGNPILDNAFLRRCLLLRTQTGGQKVIFSSYALWRNRFTDDPAHRRQDWKFMPIRVSADPTRQQQSWRIFDRYGERVDHTICSSLGDETSLLSPYQYEPLEGGCIRLLRIMPGDKSTVLETGISTGRLDQALPFETLSYTWGGARVRSISCKGSSISVSENLFQALHTLRSESEERVFWIDAICINQNDDEEKGKQVGMMHDIYTSSQRTVVWLSSPRLQAAASALMDDLVQMSRRNGEVSIEIKAEEKDWRQLGALFQDPWFTRMWIIQEVAVSKKVVVQTQSNSWPWDDFIKAAISARDHAKEFQILFDPDNAIRLSDIRQMYAEDQLSDILQALIRTRRSASSIDSDKIYAALGLSNFQFPIIYKDETPSQTFLRFAVDVIKTHGQRAMLLNLISDGIYSKHKDLPSWVPDWEVRHGPKLFASNSIFDTWHASADTVSALTLTNHDRHLKVRGFILDKIQHVGRAYRELVPFSGVAPRFKQSLQQASGSRRYLMGEYMIVNSALRAIQWHDLALKYGRYYGNSSDRYDAYLLTLIASCGFTSDKDETMADLRDGFRTWHEQMSVVAMTGDPSEITKVYSSAEASHKRAMQFITKNVDFAWGRRFFATQKHGYIGLCPSLVRRGDLVVILHGGRTPYVARRLKDGHYTFIGECYTHGIMQGEAMDKKEAEDFKDFVFI